MAVAEKVSVSFHEISKLLLVRAVNLTPVFADASTLQDPKPPHSKHTYGSLSFASSGSKNSSTSQFFISLCGPTSSSTMFSSEEMKERLERAEKKLDGKYYPFGVLVEGEELLRKLEIELEAAGVNKSEKPNVDIWVEAGGIMD